jgi:putative membrane protein
LQLRVALGLLVGVALAIGLLGEFGVRAILQALQTLGWGGFAAIVAFHLGLVLLMGVAWWLLGRARRDARLWRFVWARLIRDAASQALPLSHVGGVVLGARALTLAGVSATFATASTIVDIAVEFVGQLVYTLLGLGLLCWLRPGSRLILPILLGVGVMAVLAVLFVAVQASGSGMLERLVTRLMARWIGRQPGGAAVLPDAIRAIRGRHAALALAWLAHLASWLFTGVQAWLTLRLLHVPLGLAQALVIDSLTFGLRSLAFMVPSAIGVQEGAYVLLGALFGVGPQLALALSLTRRGRDLVIGVPALLGWQWQEGRHGRRQEGQGSPSAGIPPAGAGGTLASSALDPPRAEPLDPFT